MHKRRDLLDRISENYLKKHEVACEMFLRMLWEHYVKIDLETGNQLADIFYDLYINKNKASYDDIVFKYNIGLSTLNRYRIRFNELAEKLLPAQL